MSQDPTAEQQTPEWHSSACILCECNCGIEVQLGGDDGRQFTRIRGNRNHPESKGYVCQKAGRLNHYQNSRDRLMQPMRRRDDGSYEEVDWETAIREVAERLATVRDEHGGASIFYFGGGGQGNHLPGAYSAATRRALGSRYRSNALAQEKTGEFWVHREMFGSAAARGDFERCEVGVFLGKNPWQSHSIPRARVTLREIAKDPERALVVVDVVRTETADLADYFLQVKPATDAWLLRAMIGVLQEEDLVDHAWLDEHTSGYDQLQGFLAGIDVTADCAVCGVDEELVRAATRRIAEAQSVSFFEDLGVQMNRNSTLVSYLQRLVWLLAGGNFGTLGAHNPITSLISLVGNSKSRHTSPVVGAPIIAGLTPCNTIPEEILTDHPKRYRAMIIDAANPAHSLADSQAMREALRALEFTVVIDIAMTETAREADYVLPTPTQYEKAEATFFNFGFPHNFFHLRHPLLPPLVREDGRGPLPEAEIHARLCEALGAVPTEVVEHLRTTLRDQGHLAFAAAFQQAAGSDPRVMGMAPVVLYRTLGEALPDGLENGAALWGAAHRCAATAPDSVRRALGLEGDPKGQGPLLGEALFDRILESPHGLIFSDDRAEESFARVDQPEHRIRLDVPEMLEEARRIFGATGELTAVLTSSEFPFLLSAGERRSFTANTIYRDPAWRKKDAEGALRVSPDDAATLGVETGDLVQLRTERGSAEVPVEVNDRMQPGHVSLPNGLGVDYPGENGDPRQRRGIAPNELTSAAHRDFLAGTPWHKSVPAAVEKLA